MQLHRGHTNLSLRDPVDYMTALLGNEPRSELLVVCAYRDDADTVPYIRMARAEQVGWRLTPVEAI